MKAGDTVKVRIRHGDKHSWRTGTVIGSREIAPPVSTTVWMIGHGEFTSYRETEFESNDIKRFTPQTDEAHVANFERDLPLGLALAEEALAELLPNETVALKVSDQTISGYHGAVTIDPVQYDHETIGSFIERTGYQVTVWKHIPATRLQPDEYVDAPVGTYGTIGAAVQVFIRTIFKLKSEDYWNAKADAAAAEAWAAGEM